MPMLAHPVALATVLLVALLAVLRWAIAQARTRSLSPLVYLVVGAVAVLAVYMLARPAQTAAPAPATTQGAT
jgi:predicted membrane channel-forming protein YqfA (hemolysin III family)